MEMIVVLYLYSSNLEAPIIRESFKSIKACVTKLERLIEIEKRVSDKVIRIDKKTYTIENYINNKTILTTVKCEAVDFINQ